MTDIGHIKLRRGLLDHIETGKMKPDMLSVYTYLLLTADYTCGVVWHTSAPYIGTKFRKQAKHINRQMMKLEKEGYIKRFGHRGQINSYEVLINRYLVFNGVLIDSDNSTDINNIAWTTGLKGEITGSYRELKVDLSVFQVSSYKEVKNIRIKEVKNKSIKKPKKEKHKYGEYKHVLLTDGEKKKLKDKFGENVAKEKVVALDEAIEQYGYSYNSHYLTILNWDRKDKKKLEPQLGI